MQITRPYIYDRQSLKAETVRDSLKNTNAGVFSRGTKYLCASLGTALFSGIFAKVVLEVLKNMEDHEYLNHSFKSAIMIFMPKSHLSENLPKTVAKVSGIITGVIFIIKEVKLQLKRERLCKFFGDNPFRAILKFEFDELKKDFPQLSGLEDTYAPLFSPLNVPQHESINVPLRESILRSSTAFAKSGAFKKIIDLNTPTNEMPKIYDRIKNEYDDQIIINYLMLQMPYLTREQRLKIYTFGKENDLENLTMRCQQFFKTNPMHLDSELISTFYLTKFAKCNALEKIIDPNTLICEMKLIYGELRTQFKFLAWDDEILANYLMFQMPYLTVEQRLKIYIFAKENKMDNLIDRYEQFLLHASIREQNCNLIAHYQLSDFRKSIAATGLCTLFASIILKPLQNQFSISPHLSEAFLSTVIGTVGISIAYFVDLKNKNKRIKDFEELTRFYGI